MFGLIQQYTPQAVVILDVNPTPELEDEGLARDLVRLIQNARKAADLHVSDHIQLTLELSPDLNAAIAANESYLEEQTLTDTLTYGTPGDGAHVEEHKLGTGTVRLGITRA